MPYLYHAYGLTIASTLELPELAPLDVPVAADVTIRTAVSQRTYTNADPACLSSATGEARLAYARVGVFHICQGRTITVELIADYDPAALRSLLTGAILAMLLYQRGFIVLHASAVDIHGQAVAFLGPKRAGKSVMTASLCRSGYRMIADDVTAILPVGDQLMVRVAPPRCKLWPDAVAALGAVPDTLPRVHPSLTKRSLQMVQDRPVAYLPLRRLYVLDEAADIRMLPLAPDRAFVEILRHAYVSRWIKTPDLHLFRQCAHLANQVSVYRLERPRQFARLPDVVQMVEQADQGQPEHLDDR